MINIAVKKRFPALAMDFTFKLSSNRAVLFGPSGSGKSSLLKMMIGFSRPDEGRITAADTIIFDQEQTIDLPVHQRQFGYLPQDYTLFPNMSVNENILYGLKARKIPYSQKDLNEVVEKLGIAGRLAARPAELSGGQQQRVALARLMLINPRALLLDEPFSALDTPVREALRDLVIDLSDEANIPALLVTHDLEEALAFGRELVIISGGRVIEYGSKDSIFHCPRYVETARMLGFQTRPIVSSDEKTVRTKSGETFTHNSKEAREARYIGIRPENIMIQREDRPDSGRENLLSGKVTGLHHRAGYIRLVFCSTRGENYLIHAPEHVIRVMGIIRGKKIKISLKSESLIFCSRKTPQT
ncbi:hypothetical protein MNBD_DELTA03-616 [hydrothermal vent metagenome]|uniref:ABC transporter domain-containing protein n=1 Tax=hydrothermal vent metagenome TaxID=652676 RepID=A0A3B0VPC1_9ZZZZ